MFVLICLALIAVYVFIPANIKIGNVVFIKTKPAVVNRLLMNEAKWVKWLSPDSVYSGNSFRFKDYDYDFDNTIMNTTGVSISNKRRSVNSLINVIPVNEDSVAVEWKAEINAGSNPISRISSYSEAEKMKENMGAILGQLQIFLDKKENAYGLDITEHQVADTILISTKYFSDTFPTTQEIYALIGDLRAYISKEGARETNPPMLNINNDSGNYRTMVAIPVDRILPEKGNYVFKRMVPGKILVAEVKGGDYTARQALKQIDLYLGDHHLSSPAIPFESLITDRSQEPDTTKWVTKIYYPIY